MDINIKTIKEVTVVEIAGEIDANTATGITQIVLPLVQPHCRLLLDMTEVLYMSSAGLRMLLLVYRQASTQEGRIVLVGLSQEIEDTMFITGFLNFFTICKTLDLGLETFPSSGNFSLL
jgi:anti-sigma B factor antagonist